VEADEHAMEAWRQAFLRDVADEESFFAQQKSERRAEREGIS
jgi:hypothetical protein